MNARNPTLFMLQRAGIWVYNNPAETAVLAYALRYAPAKLGLVAIETAKYNAIIARPTIQWGTAIARIVLGARGLAVLGATTTAVVYTGAVAVGVAAGVVVGTAASGAIFGPEGREKAIEFYTGQADNFYDYIPHYNAYKIVKHYVQH